MAADRLGQAEKERHWLGVVQRWQASGLNQLAFCREEGIDEKQFYYWRSRLEKRHLVPMVSACNQVATEKVFDTQQRDQFVPVEIKSLPAKVGVQGRTSDRLEIVTPGGYVVRIP